MPKANPEKSAISTFDLFERFPDAESARKYFESRLWPNGVVCPVCGLGERITARAGGYYRCNQCAEDFAVRTVMERSHIPLHKWLYAMYLLVTARKGISSLQLAKEIGVTQKTAWFLLHRMRRALSRSSSRGACVVALALISLAVDTRAQHQRPRRAPSVPSASSSLDQRLVGEPLSGGAVDKTVDSIERGSFIYLSFLK